MIQVLPTVGLAFAAVAGLLALRKVLFPVLMAAGVPSYRVTDDDLLQLARAGLGEAGTNQAGVAAVFWALANHYMRMPNKRALYPSLGAFTRAYSTPLHPGRRHSTMPWSEIPLSVRELVKRWAKGQVPSPIGARTDWRADWAGWSL